MRADDEKTYQLGNVEQFHISLFCNLQIILYTTKQFSWVYNRNNTRLPNDRSENMIIITKIRIKVMKISILIVFKNTRTYQDSHSVSFLCAAWIGWIQIWWMMPTLTFALPRYTLIVTKLTIRWSWWIGHLDCPSRMWRGGNAHCGGLRAAAVG